MNTLEPHGCRDCYEINRGFTLGEDGQRICMECRGTVLTLQEAFDLIADHKVHIRELEGWNE